MADSPRTSPGFTIVELLVVISIIAILMALLLPAVNAARESGRRATCRNNVQNISKATQIHVEKFGYYPSGGWGGKWIGDPDMGFGAKQPGSWLYSLTPFLGLENVHDMAKLPSYTLADPLPANKKAALGEMRALADKLFICPSRRNPTAYPNSPDSSDNPVNATVGTTVSVKTDYAACAGYPTGTSGDARQLTGGPSVGDPVKCMKAYPDPDGKICVNEDSVPWKPQPFNGVCYRRSEVQPGAIRDGASQTMFAAEKFMNSLLYSTGTAGSDRRSAYQGYSTDTIRFTPNPSSISASWAPHRDEKVDGEDPTGKGSDQTKNQHSRIFGSAHSNGFHAAFCDGSVQHLSFGIELGIFGQLGARNDTDPPLKMAPVDMSQLP